MAYTVNIKRSAEKAVRAIPQKKLRERVEDAIEALAEDPRPDGVKKLASPGRGAQASPGVDLYRIAEGSFRIVYTVNDDELVVLVVLVAQREGVYELLKRMGMGG